MLKHARGALVEYTTSVPPLTFVFDFNPQTISRTRTITLKTEAPPGMRGYGFASPAEVPRISQGVAVQPESFSIDILLDVTDAMMSGDPIAAKLGIEPQLDVLRSMVEPKVQGPGGVRMLASLGVGSARAFERSESASVLLFVWGSHILPIFLTSVKVEEKAHLPSLKPYRANVGLTMQVIEGQNPFYVAEQTRQMIGAGQGTVYEVGDLLGGVF